MLKSFLPRSRVRVKPHQTNRQDLSSQVLSLPIADLIGHQIDSFNKFIEQTLPDLFRDELGLIEDSNERLSLRFKKINFRPPTKTPEEVRHIEQTYEAALECEVDLIYHQSKEETRVLKTETVNLHRYPWMTDNGTFVINGHERVIVNQLIRSTGVFFTIANSNLKLYAATVRARSLLLEIETLKTNEIIVKIDRRRRLPVTMLLTALGMSRQQIKSRFSEVDNGQVSYIDATFAKDNSKTVADAAAAIYSRLRPGDISGSKSAQEFVEQRFYDPRRYDLLEVGRHKINTRLGLSRKARTLNLDDLVAIISEVIRLNNTGDPPDDIDSLENRRVLSIDELLAQQFRVGMLRLSRFVRDRMNTCDIETITPRQLVNPRIISSEVHKFFRMSQLCRFMKQTNILSELSEKRSLTSTGPGGLNAKRASEAVRDAHPTHYGRVCVVETPESNKIGLNLYLSLYSRINSYGFIETPYWKIIQKLPAKDLVGEIARVDFVDPTTKKVIVAAEEKISQAQADRLAKIDSEKLWLIQTRISKEIEYLDAYQEKKACVLSNAPIDENGYFFFKYVQGRKGHQAGLFETTDGTHLDISSQQIIGVSPGLVPFLDKDLVMRATVGSSQAKHSIPLVRPESPIIASGLEEVIARHSDKIVYAEGDGVVISATADQVVVQYKNQAGPTTYPLIHYLRTNNNTSVNQKVVVDRDQKIKSGDILIEGFSIQNGELALGRDLLTAVMCWDGYNFEDAVVINERLVKDDLLTSVNIQEYSVDIKQTKLGDEEITRDIPNASEYLSRHLDEGGIVRLGAEVKSQDILVGIITPKGEKESSNEMKLLRAIFGEKAKDYKNSSLTLPDGVSGRVVGLKIFRKEDGDKLRAQVLERITVFVAQTLKIQIGDKLAGRHGNKGVIATVLPDEDMPFTADGQTVDMIVNPVGIPARMNLGQLFEAHLGMAAAKLNTKFISSPFGGPNNDKISELLTKAGLPADGKVQLFDGRSGKPFDRRTTVGYMYIYKLDHMVVNKIHARSTGHYSPISQQPTSGKAKKGGQRFGEMEVWGLAAHGAAYGLQEMLTYKSDDVLGRGRVLSAILNQTEVVSPSAPASFNVLVKELQGLCLKIDLIDTANNKTIDPENLMNSTPVRQQPNDKQVSNNKV